VVLVHPVSVVGVAGDAVGVDVAAVGVKGDLFALFAHVDGELLGCPAALGAMVGVADGEPALGDGGPGAYSEASAGS